MLGVLGTDNVQKKFGDDILKIAEFFLISIFWWKFRGNFFVFKESKKERKVRH